MDWRDSLSRVMEYFTPCALISITKKHHAREKCRAWCSPNIIRVYESYFFLFLFCFGFFTSFL